MNKNQIRTLISVNLRYVSPQITDKERKKGKNGKALTRSILNQYIFSGVLFLVIYGAMLVMVDFAKMPGFFTYYMALFGLLAFSQAVSVIFNIFFESKDLPAYLSLPFSQSEIFLSKILVVALTVVPFAFPLLILFVLTGIRSGVFIIISIVLAIALFMLFLALLFGISSLLVFGLTKTKIFKKHKKLFTTLLLGLTMVLVVGSILLMNMGSSSSMIETDRSVIGIFLPFYNVMHAPLSIGGISSFIGILLLTVVILWILKATILPKLYEQLTEISSSGEAQKKRTYKANQNQTQLLRAYNLQLLKDPNMVLQILSTSIMMPVIFMVSFTIGAQGKNLSGLPYKFLGVAFFIGLLLATLTINQTSFIGNMISLDRENFSFIKSLPFSMRRYLKVKFDVGFWLQTGMNILLILIGSLLLRVGIMFVFAALLGAILGSYLLSLRYFARDYRFLLLDWTNINQLFTRGAGTLGMVLTLFGSLIVSIILVAAYGIAVSLLSALWVNLVAFTALAVFSFLWIKYYHDNFWRQFV